VGGDGVQTGSTLHVGHFWPIVPAPGDSEDGESGRMKIGRGNRSTRRNPAPAPICSPLIPLDQTGARTWPAVVGRQRLTAWAMARLKETPKNFTFKIKAVTANLLLFAAVSYLFQKELNAWRKKTARRKLVEGGPEISLICGTPVWMFSVLILNFTTASQSEWKCPQS
jgi:hypothetical protein